MKSLKTLYFYVSVFHKMEMVIKKDKFNLFITQLTKIMGICKILMLVCIFLIVCIIYLQNLRKLLKSAKSLIKSVKNYAVF